jgi:hypothetical protein
MTRGMMLGIKERAEKSNGPSNSQRVVSVEAFGQVISLSPDTALAPQVETQVVPAVPLNDQILFSEAHPAFVQFRFAGYQNGRSFELPVYPFEAQIRIFQTADFPGYANDSPYGFPDQKQSLIALLENGLDPARCASPLVDDPGLPFLPWVNMKQAFCAQPELVEFASGRGIRYLAWYSQGPNPVLDQQVFYTFQGLSDDGQYYIAALFPVQTGIFPNAPAACNECGDADPFAEMTSLLARQLTELNALEANSFSPSLTVLDDVIRSLRIE